MTTEPPAMTTEPPAEIIARALQTARVSPCAKSKRGCIVYAPIGALPPATSPHSRLPIADGYAILGAGYNGQPEPWVCRGRESCGDACNKLCVHAEVRAIRLAISQTMEIHGTDLLEVGRAVLVHVKLTSDEQLATSGPPSCWQCSREILDAPLAAVWLYQETGWRRYDAVEFHAATLRICGLAHGLEDDLW